MGHIYTLNTLRHIYTLHTLGNFYSLHTLGHFYTLHTWDTFLPFHLRYITHKLTNYYNIGIGFIPIKMQYRYWYLSSIGIVSDMNFSLVLVLARGSVSVWSYGTDTDTDTRYIMSEHTWYRYWSLSDIDTSMGIRVCMYLNPHISINLQTGISICGTLITIHYTSRNNKDTLHSTHKLRVILCKRAT